MDNLPMEKFNIAIIFDMDGVIVDNHAFHMKAWMQFFNDHGLPLSEQEYKQQINGRPLAEIIPQYFGKHFTPAMSRQLGEEKEAAYRELYKDHIVPTPGLVDFLEILEEKNIPKAIATSAPPANVDFTLQSTGLKRYFSIITDDSMITQGKPNPEVYLTSADQLHTPPHRCIVFEDAILGVQAGKNAGMKVVGVATTHPREELENTDYIIDNFEGLSLEELLDKLHM